MYVDYKFWHNRQTGVITLDEEMNLEIRNGTKFEFRMDLEKLHKVIGKTNVSNWTYNTYTDAYELDKGIKNTESNLMGIIYENKE